MSAGRHAHVGSCACRCCRQPNRHKQFRVSGTEMQHHAQGHSQGPAVCSSRRWRLWVAVFGALLVASASPAAAQQRLHAEITRHHPKIFVAPLPDVFNYRVLTDYDVKR
jgi:hypothetical protein